jgi:hypothetical protein
MDANIKYSLPFARSLYNECVDWSKNADNKAKILLTLLGLFIGFFTSTVFVEGKDLKKIIDCTTPSIWGVLIAMAFMWSLSIYCGLRCLWSRVILSKNERDEIDRSKTNGSYRMSGRMTGFFGLLWRVEKDQFKDRVQSFQCNDELDIRLEQIYTFAKRVYKKHRWVNFGFVFGGISLWLLLLSSVLYILNVSEGKCL